MLGYMALVTVLMLVFGGISLIYLYRTVGGADRRDRGGGRQGRARRGRHPRLRRSSRSRPTSSGPRMSARVPVDGLAVVPRLDGDAARDGDRRRPGTVDARAPQPHRGGDPGRRPSGGTASCPTRSPRSTGRSCSTVGFPVDQFLAAGHRSRADLNRVYELQDADRRGQTRQKGPAGDHFGRRIGQLDAAIARNTAELEKAQAEYESLQTEGRRPARRGRQRPRRGRRAARRPPISAEMTFTVYRTTKGKVGEPVYASMQVTNSAHRRRVQRHLPDQGILHQPAGRFPRRVLVGSPGRPRASRSSASARPSTWAWPRATCSCCRQLRAVLGSTT